MPPTEKKRGDGLERRPPAGIAVRRAATAHRCLCQSAGTAGNAGLQTGTATRQGREIAERRSTSLAPQKDIAPEADIAPRKGPRRIRGVLRGRTRLAAHQDHSVLPAGQFHDLVRGPVPLAGSPRPAQPIADGCRRMKPVQHEL